MWLDVDRRLRRGELDADGAIKELIELIDKADGFGDHMGNQHWALGALGFHGPVLLMDWGIYGGPRLYAPLHRESWEEAGRRH